MKQILQLMTLAVLALSGRLMALTPVVITPEARINLTAISDKILLVEVEKVDLDQPAVYEGIESRRIKVHGKVIENVRGKGGSDKFDADEILISVVDADAFMKSHPDDGLLLDVYYCRKDQESGIRDCKVGKRYLVIYPSFGLHGPFYVELSKDNNDWRKLIKKRREDPEFDPPKKPANTHKASK